MAKIKVCVRSRGKHGFYISSVPVNQISELAKFRKRRWSFEDGFLVLEAF